MLTLTLSLGVWQVERLAWKRGLLQELDRGEQAPPVPLATTQDAFRRVVLEGTFLPLVARYGAEVRSTRAGPAMGAHVLTPMQRPGADPVLIDRGWAPMDFDTTPPVGPVRIVAYVRPPEYPVRFGASDDPANRRFYALDPVAIGASLGLPRVAPFTLVALGAQGAFPEPATTLPRPPNDHLSYAATWFGLSLALIVVFIVYVAQTRAAQTRVAQTRRQHGAAPP